jgi:hypothetical protein
MPPDGYDIIVSADFSARAVRVDVAGLFFTMAPRVAFAFAKQVEGAADALGPEPPPAKDEAIDITDQVEGETKR